MTRSIPHITLLIAAGLFLSGCYTQVKTVHSDRGVHPSAPDRQAPVEQRSGQIVSEEDYVLGYEDGWDDAEEFYFKDYEAKQWYLDHGINLAHNPHARRAAYSSVHHHHHYFGSYYYPPYFHRYYSPSRWHFSMAFHYGWYRPYHSFGWAYYSPYRFYDPFYSYYGYYGGGYWGYGGWYSRPIVVYSTRTVRRDYGPRSTGLATRGNVIRNRGVATTASRSAIRTNARSSQVNNRSAVNRTTTRSAIRSNASSRTNSRGTVNRSSSTNRSTGTVNRTRSNNNSSGSVNRTRSSSNNRSSGTVNRNNSNNRSSGSSANRNRSNNDNRQAAVQNDQRTRTVTSARSSDTVRVDEERTINRSNLEVNRPVNRTAVQNRVRSANADTRLSSPSQRMEVLNERSSRSSSIFGTIGRAVLNSNGINTSTNFRSATRNSSTRSAVNRRTNTRSSSGTVNRSSNNRSSSGTSVRSSNNRSNSSGNSSRNRSSSSNNRGN
jgi:hypothetical protein